jgi:hypothetical protein
MLSDMAYHLIVSLLEAFMWDGELAGAENLQDGPGVIVTNHMGAIGPVGICCSLPMRVYPWVLGETVDPIAGPERVRTEFVEKTLRIPPPLSGKIAKSLCKLSTPLLLGVGCIPVPTSHEEQATTFQRSLAILKQEKFLLVAPEDPDGIPDRATGITPFKHGFLRLGELYASETGKRLPFYPVTIHQAGWVIVGRPFVYNPQNEPHEERLRMINLLESTIKATHMEITRGETNEPVMLAPQ